MLSQNLQYCDSRPKVMRAHLGKLKSMKKKEKGGKMMSRSHTGIFASRISFMYFLSHIVKVVVQIQSLDI